ncbi:alcohol dehydrogenase superfamily, zinc-type protein, partial [Kipferlia bialata]|eukprot:g4958.t1
MQTGESEHSPAKRSMGPSRDTPRTTAEQMKLVDLILACIESTSLVYDTYGEPEDVLFTSEKEISTSGFGPEDCIVSWIAAPVNPSDINQVQGRYGIQPPLPAVGGNEGVGVVVMAGKDAGVRMTDVVIPRRAGLGTWRNRCVLKGTDLIKVDLDIMGPQLNLATQLGVNPPTALLLLRQFVGLERGDSVIQNAGDSALARCVTQIAKTRGINVISVIRDDI